MRRRVQEDIPEEEQMYINDEISEHDDDSIVDNLFDEDMPDDEYEDEEDYDDYDDGICYDSDWSDYGRSGEKYGWYNGFSDDVIDDVFDGDPEATWNID